jgi:hypothetical protein
MVDINDIKEQLETAQSNMQSASWASDQALDNARDATSSADSALSALESIIDEIDSITGYSKHDVEQAMRHVNYIVKLQALFMNRLDNLIDGNQSDDKMRFVNLIAFVELLTFHEDGRLAWDNAYKLEAFYEVSEYGYKTVKSEEV